MNEAYDPYFDGFPHALDLLAMNEGTLPTIAMNTPGQAEAFLGIEHGTYRPDVHFPALLAKWRYACAIEMVKAGKASRQNLHATETCQRKES